MIPNLVTSIGGLLLFCSVYSQSSLSSTPISMAQGGVSSTLSDVWSTRLNPAGIGASNMFETGVSYAMPFALSELGTQNISTILPTKVGNFGAYYQSFGFSLYKEHNAGVAYSRMITEQFSAGFQVNFANYYSSQSGSGSQVYSSAGIQFIPLQQIVIGAAIINPEQSSLLINNEEVQIPSFYTLGISWIASEAFSLSYEFEKQSNFGAVSKFGLEYSYRDFLWIRGGVSGKPILYSFGFGLKINRFTIDYAANYHEALGLTSNIGLTINWQRDELK